MYIKSKFRIILSLTLAIWFLAGTNIYALTLEEVSEPNELTIQISENTVITLSKDSLQTLREKNISIEEFKASAKQSAIEFLNKNNLSCEKNVPIKVPAQSSSSLPPGSSTETKRGSNRASVFAGIPALGICYIDIDYTYDYTKWWHTLYGVDGCIINSGSRVTGSTLRGVYLCTWKHSRGTITYSKSASRGKNLEIVAIGDLTAGIDIQIGPVAIPAHVTTEQSFIHFHPI